MSEERRARIDRVFSVEAEGALCWGVVALARESRQAYSAKSASPSGVLRRQPGGFEGFVPIAEHHSLDRPAIALEDDALVGDDSRAALPTAPPEPDDGHDLVAASIRSTNSMLNSSHASSQRFHASSATLIAAISRGRPSYRAALSRAARTPLQARP